MIDFHFKTYGDTQNQPLLMLHGFMGDSSDWEPLANRLQENFYCVTLDLPGHGETKSDNESDYTIEKTSESIVEFLKDQKIENPYLLGYSMGGRMAFYLLTNYPKTFRKAVIESSSPGLKTEQEKKERVQKDLLLSKRMQMHPMEQFLQDWYNLDLFSSIDKKSDTFLKMIALKSKNNIKQLTLSLKHSGTGVMPSLWNSLDEIKADVLLITGSLDKKYSAIAQKICMKHPKFSHEIIDDVSHNVHFEKEDLFYNTIENYLK